MSWNTEVWKMGVVTARVVLNRFPAWMAVVVGPQGLGMVVAPTPSIGA